MKRTRLQPKRALTHKQLAFVEHYLITLNAAEAVRRAGYNSKNPEKLGTELLHHPEMRRQIDDVLAKRTKKNEVSAQYVVEKLISIVENCESDNPQAALRGLELIGKHLGMYRDRQEISGPDGRAIELEQRKREDVNDFTDRLSNLVESKPGSNSGSDDRGNEGRVVSISR